MKRLIMALVVAAAGSKEPGRITGRLLPPDYRSWAVISPPGHAVPQELAALCVAVAPPPSGSSGGAFGPHTNTFVKVFANKNGKVFLGSSVTYPEGTVFVKEKTGNAATGEPVGVGVAIKGARGTNPAAGDWKFAYYPSEPGASSTACATCHRNASHDYIFARPEE